MTNEKLFYTIPVYCTVEEDKQERRVAKLFYATYEEAVKGIEKDLNEYWKVDFDRLDEFKLVDETFILESLRLQVENMVIKQFKEFEKEFTFSGILEEKALLEKVKNNTFLSYVTLSCKTIEERLLNSNRTKHDKNGIIFFSYILYLCSFTNGLYSNFDIILKVLDKNINTYIDPITLKEILNNKL